MTRFDYFADIEETFIRLRGKALILGPLDWELIHQWKTNGVPLHIVLRSIEEVFKNHEARKKARPITSLAYCKSEVEAQFAEWQQSRVGAHESEPGEVATGAAARDAFPVETVKEYLASTMETLLRLTIERAKARVSDKPDWETPAEEVDDGLYWAMLAATNELVDLARKFTDQPNARALEEKLTGLERNLERAMEEVATPEQIAEARAAAEALFAPYKGKMPEKVYEQQIDSHLKKHLHKIFGVPRLSLFHMKG